MPDRINKRPAPRCPHRVSAKTVDLEDGWKQVVGPEACGICITGEPIGIRFKPPGPETKGRRAGARKKPRKIIECPKPGCCLMITEGRPHRNSPCLIVPDDAPPGVYESRFQDGKGNLTWRARDCPKCGARVGYPCRLMTNKGKRKAGTSIDRPHNERRKPSDLDKPDKKN